MASANRWIIFSALGSLELHEAMHGEINCNPDDERDMVRIFRDLVKPDIDRWDSASRTKLKLALAYYMNRPDVLEDVLASLQDLSMPDPKDFTAFFQWFWRALFPFDRWQEVQIDGVLESNDPMEINDIRRR